MAAYCLLARLDHTDDDLRADGTLQREAEMAFHVRAALDARKPGDGPVLVVLGGFHAVALPDLLAGPPDTPARAIPERTVTSDAALIRFTFDRLERLNGYAAGMTSPAWHQLLWEHLTQTGRPRDGAAAQRGHPGLPARHHPRAATQAPGAGAAAGRLRGVRPGPAARRRCATARRRCAATCSMR